MRPVSDRWLSTIRGAHRAVFEARVIEPPDVYTLSTGVDPAGTVIPIRGGDVIWDTDADVLATVQIQVDPSLWPTGPESLLAPYGNELFIRRGIEYGDGSTEWVSLGYFRINAVEQADARGGSLTVSGSDRMWRIIRNPYFVGTLASTMTYGDAVEWLVTTASVPATIEWDDTALRDTVMGRTVVVDHDRFGALRDLIESIDQIAYFDYRGILCVRPVPSPTTPVWSVDSGESGVLVTLARSLDDSELCNVVYVVGSGEGVGGIPPTAYRPVTDALPWLESPTKYGVVVKIVRNSDITSNTEATALASRVLAQSVGLPYQLDFAAVPNAALEPWDAVQVQLGTGLSTTHVLRRLTIPLSVDQPVTADTREYVSET